MARQDSRHKGPEEGRDANFQRTVFYGELQEGKRFCDTQSLTDFDIRAATRENRSSGFPTRCDTNRSIQSQEQARYLKFWL